MPLRSVIARQAGDTIVEVMIVLAVLGLAIGISFSTANRSLLDARQAQENAQATERLQAQIENLRTMAANQPTLPNGSPNPDYIFQPAGQHFCTYNNASGYHVQQITAGPPPAACHTDNLYDVNIVYVAAGPSIIGGTFSLVGTWPDVQGQGNDTVTLSYRYYPL